MIYLSKAIVKCPNIKILDIYDNLMSKEAITELQKSLSTGECPDLTTLGICGDLDDLKILMSKVSKACPSLRPVGRIYICILYLYRNTCISRITSRN